MKVPGLSVQTMGKALGGQGGLPGEGMSNPRRSSANPAEAHPGGVGCGVCGGGGC